MANFTGYALRGAGCGVRVEGCALRVAGYGSRWRAGISDWGLVELIEFIGLIKLIRLKDFSLFD